jgi:RNA polymerase sigma-70 factor (ECF subfamily)
MSGKATEKSDELERLLFGIRPRLHRFCARMLGSAIDGEDVAQEAALKAVEAFPHQSEIHNLEAWIFRIARNTALDFLRRRSRERTVPVEDDADFVDPYMDTDRGLQAAESLRQFMRLPPLQRASVILMDVIGYSISEVADILETTIPAVKASLHRGRERLQRLAAEPAPAPLEKLPDAEMKLLGQYVERFNARDFDALRALLADDVRLHVKSERRVGAPVRDYYTRYASIFDIRLVPGIIEGQPVALAYRNDVLSYFIAFDWRDEHVVKILDFRYAPYVLESVTATPIAA